MLGFKAYWFTTFNFKKREQENQGHTLFSVDVTKISLDVVYQYLKRFVRFWTIFYDQVSYKTDFFEETDP